MGSNTRISVSALGRDVVVGDLYNYYTDDILKSKWCEIVSSSLFVIINECYLFFFVFFLK
jgi:hypothetical protein